MGPGTILVAAVAFGVIVLISKSIRVVQQAQTMIVERLGKYHKTLSSGINFVLPLIDRPRSVDWHQTIVTPAGDSYSRRFRTERIDLRETVYVFPRQNVITKDNVVVEIDALIYSQVTDPVRATYEIANLPDAIEKLTQTTLRNVIGEMELDHVLSSRDMINAKLRAILDEATHKWGAKVSRVDDDHVVLGDHVLPREHVHRLAQVDLLSAEMACERVARRRHDHLVPIDRPRLVDDRDDQVHPGGERAVVPPQPRSEEHTSELQSPCNLVCRLLLEKKKNSAA